MLTLPDLEEKKIVFVRSEGDLADNLKFWNNNLRLYRDGKKVNQISCHLILSVFIIGHATLTTVLIQKLKKHGVSIFLLNQSYQVYAEIMSEAEGNTQLREIQYTMTKPTQLQMAKLLVSNKITNQKELLDHYKAKGGISLKDAQASIEKTTTLQELLGVEGNCAHGYFKSLFSQIGWYRRAPQTREDIPNLLLDIGYTFVFNIVDAIARLFGFDTYKGFYHQLFFQRKSLSCDLMEPMRAMVDRQLIKSYHLGQVSEKDFKFTDGSFRFRDSDAAKKYLSIWSELIMDHKDDIYLYILGYYRHIMNPDRYPFPHYEL